MSMSALIIPFRLQGIRDHFVIWNCHFGMHAYVSSLSSYKTSQASAQDIPKSYSSPLAHLCLAPWLYSHVTLTEPEANSSGPRLLGNIQFYLLLLSVATFLLGAIIPGQLALPFHSLESVSTNHQSIGQSLRHPSFLDDVQSVISIASSWSIRRREFEPSNDTNWSTSLGGYLISAGPIDLDSQSRLLREAHWVKR
jgi:hypothetical protein